MKKKAFELATSAEECTHKKRLKLTNSPRQLNQLCAAGGESTGMSAHEEVWERALADEITDCLQESAKDKRVKNEVHPECAAEPVWPDFCQDLKLCCAYSCEPIVDSFKGGFWSCCLDIWDMHGGQPRTQSAVLDDASWAPQTTVYTCWFLSLSPQYLPPPLSTARKSPLSVFERFTENDSVHQLESLRWWPECDVRYHPCNSVAAYDGQFRVCCDRGSRHHSKKDSKTCRYQ